MTLRGHEVGGTQDPKMLRGRGTGAAGSVLELAHTHGSVAQQLEDMDALRMSHGPKERSLETTQGDRFSLALVGRAHGRKPSASARRAYMGMLAGRVVESRVAESR